MERISGFPQTEDTGSTENHAGCPGCRGQKQPAGDMTAEKRQIEEAVSENESLECGCRLKHREGEEYRNLMNRLKRIEGQIRGIQGMVEEERYCVDILTQVMAVQSALNSFNKALLSNHIKTCVVRDIQAGNHEVVDELCGTIQKLMK